MSESTKLLPNKVLDIDMIIPASVAKTAKVTDEGLEFDMNILELIAKADKQSGGKLSEHDMVRLKLNGKFFQVKEERLRELIEYYYSVIKEKSKTENNNRLSHADSKNAKSKMQNAELNNEEGLGAVEFIIAAHGMQSCFLGNIIDSLNGNAFIPLGQSIAIGLVACLGINGAKRAIKEVENRQGGNNKKMVEVDEQFIKTMVEPLQRLEPRLIRLKNIAGIKKENLSEGAYRRWLTQQLLIIFAELKLPGATVEVRKNRMIFESRVKKLVREDNESVITSNDLEKLNDKINDNEESSEKPDNKKQEQEDKKNENIDKEVQRSL